jgi:GTPase SAR1 family protein
VEFARLKVVLNMNKIDVRNVKSNMIITMVFVYLRIVLIGFMISAFLVNKVTRTKVEFV